MPIKNQDGNGFEAAALEALLLANSALPRPET